MNTSRQLTLADSIDGDDFLLYSLQQMQLDGQGLNGGALEAGDINRQVSERLIESFLQTLRKQRNRGKKKSGFEFQAAV
jgi:hypothetical protein